MKRVDELKAAVVGIGFIGIVHIEALRRLGVEVVGVVEPSAAVVEGKSAVYPVPPVYESFEAMLADPRVDVVHVTSPNFLHYPQAKAVLAAGKHVVCEKPLALDPVESAELVALAEASGLVHCTNFSIRFYPQNQEARARILAGDIGDVYNVHGSYLQDWLLLETDWNWRLEPELGGVLRAVADIGSHWLDLAQFLTGRRIESVFADLLTALPTRLKPTTEVQTYASVEGVQTMPVAIRTEDVAHLLLRFEGGMRGSCVVSQVSAGRRNQVAWEVDGSKGAIAWSSDRNEELWLGHRGEPNGIHTRERGSVPPGHPEGFQDAFKDVYASVYRAVANGEPGDDYPTFRDGHTENVLADAVLRAHTSQTWTRVEL